MAGGKGSRPDAVPPKSTVLNKEERALKIAKLKTDIEYGNLYKLTNLSIQYLMDQLVSRKVLRKEKIDIAKSIVAKAIPRDFGAGDGEAKSFSELIKEMTKKTKPVIIQNNITVDSEKKVIIDVENKEK